MTVVTIAAMATDATIQPILIDDIVRTASGRVMHFGLNNSGEAMSNERETCISDLRAAIEGECDGLHTTYQQAAAIIDYMDSEQSASQSSDDEFKNFHRMLCERFGYSHDEKDWKRDQLSLIEWIATRASEAQKTAPAGWVIAPAEPTPAMSAAGFAVSDAEHDPAAVYRAMIAAAKPVSVVQDALLAARTTDAKGAE